MSKFNTNATIPMTTNNEGWAAYEMNPRTKLVTQVLTSFFNESKFYGDNSEEIKETIRQVVKTDPKFVSQLAIFARREFNMRSISHVLVGYLAHEPEGKPYVRYTVKNIVLRGDDATEILAFYISTFGKPIPNSLRKALRDIFPAFDAYTLAKYKGEGKDVKMKDILCLCHPTPSGDQQSETWKKLLEDRLEPAYTWETELSAKGNNAETWEGLIGSGRLPYMAMLRNLRNIMNAKPENMSTVFERIANPEEVRKSKQLPFRYLSAYRNIPYDSWEKNLAWDALETAADISVDNLPKISGRTVIAIDVSGSMTQPVSEKSDIQCAQIALLLGIIANRICESARVFTFDNYIHELQVRKRDGMLKAVLDADICGGGTDMGLPFRKMISDGIECDRLIILSDNECNTSGYYGWGHRRPVQQLADEYRRQSGRNIWVHAVDLQGYGTQQFSGPKTNIIAGWSEKIFEFILLAEQGEGSLEKRISEYIPR